MNPRAFTSLPIRGTALGGLLPAWGNPLPATRVPESARGQLPGVEVGTSSARAFYSAAKPDA